MNMANFDAKRLFDTVERYIPVTLKDGDHELTIMMPEDDLKDQPQEVIKERYFAALLRFRVAEKLLDRERIKERVNKYGRSLLDMIAEMAATVIATNVIAIYMERSKESQEEFSHLNSQETTNLISKLSNLLRQPVLSTLAKIGKTAEHLEEWLWQNITAWALADIEKDLGSQTIQNMSDEDFIRTLNEYVFDKQDVKVVLIKLMGLYAQDLARLILDALDPEHMPLEELHRFLELPEAVNIHIPDAFRNGSALVPDNPATATVIAAIYAGGPQARNLVGGWKVSPSGGPVFERWLRNGGRILTYPGIEARPDAPLPTAESLWSFVERLGPFTADVALAVLAQMVEPSNGNRPQYPLLEPVPITAEAILRYKGIQRYGMERRILEMRIAEAMDQLQALRFDVEQLRTIDPATNKPVRGGASWRGDRLFDIVKVTKWQEDLFGERKQIGVGWTVRAGQWAYYWFNAQGRVWLARMSKVLLELDHRENRPAAVFAKKIGWYLSTVANRSRKFYIQIRKLLEDIGELPVPEARDKHWAGRTRNRFDEAMLTLREAGVLQTVEWPDGCGPEDSDRSKGWVQRWLDAHVSGTLPEAAPELPRRQAVQALPPRRRRRHKDPAPEQTQIDGLAIRKARMERNWSQEELARHLGISRSYLAKLETGKRLPSQDLARKLEAWLAEQIGYHAL